MSTDTMLVSTAISLAVAALLLLLLLRNFLSWREKTNSRRPPGPPGWPFFGNLLYIGDDYKSIHRKLVELRKKYGPLFMIRMGALNMLVIASADTAMELFKSHDRDFFNRLPIQGLRTSVDKMTPWSPYGPIWRMNRRLYATCFSHTTMKKTLAKRKQFVDQLKQWIFVEEKEGRSVEIKHFTMVAFANLLGNLFFSRDVMDLKSSTRSELYQLIEEIGVLITMPNLADIFPWLRNLDPQNVAKRMKKAIHAGVNIVDGFAKERRSMHVLNNEEKDFWDVLTDFEGNGKDEPRKLSDWQINRFIMEMFISVSDTVSSSVEWVMTELMRKPEIMGKAKDEISQVVGYNRKIEESDVESLPYLGAVIKETLRLHPLAPLLIPRTTIEDTEFMGYTTPKDTAVLVNVWGIGRDSALWDDPHLFNPERFLGNTMDYRGQHSRFLPFGSGRHICAGLPMAHQLIHIAVGSLLQSFDWTLEKGVTPESIDMKEKLNMSLQKSTPLRIIPTATALAV